MCCLYNSPWLWRWLLYRLSKHQTLSLTTALFTTNYSHLDDHNNYSAYSVELILFLLCHFFYANIVFFCSICSSFQQLFIRYLTSAFSCIKFQCFLLYFKLQVLLVDTNTGTPLPFGTLGIHKVLILHL